MKTRILASSILLGVFASLAACVEHRPLRTEVYDENVYLPKDFLTRENPLRKGTGDHGWLYAATIVKGSYPDTGFLTLGDNAPARYVRFQLANDRLEMVDDNEMYPPTKDKDGKPATPKSLTSAVMNSWPGTHVDIQLKDNLDGERTNVIEENRERPWEQRQQFKIDFSKATVPDLNMVGWYLDGIARPCLEPTSVALVPGSFTLEEKAGQGGDDYMSWTVAVTFVTAIIDGQYYCGNQISDAMDRHSFTYHVKYSFWRPPQSSYKPLELAEKDPIRQVAMPFETGVWGRLTMFTDPKTDLEGARSYANRFDPEKNHTFYFTESFPEKYKEHFKTVVTKQVNDLMASANVKMQIDFKDWNADGKIRTFGDIRYSFLHFQDVPFAGNPIGMAYHVADPRTGELLSGGFNMYEWEDQLYAFLVQDYLSENSSDLFDDAKSPLPTPCKPGDTVKLDEKKIAEKHKSTSLYSKLETYMKEPFESWVPKRSDDFHKHMRSLLPDLRFAYPPWNAFVGASKTDWRKQLGELRSVDRKFQAALGELDRGQNPFGGSALDKSTIARGVQHIRDMKGYVKNHFALRAHQELVNAYRKAEFMESWELGPAIARAARVCKSDGKWETRDEWAQRLVDNWFLVFSVHEFGHTLGLRHNFYGSLDSPHMEKNQITSSIMEYAFTLAEGAEEAKYKPWDTMALKWLYGGVKPDAKENFLFCTDEHVALSPLCTRHDIGVTPTEILRNEIEYYEWNYKFRNFRAYRKFWNTAPYGSAMLNRLYPMRRFLNLWALNWSESQIKNDLILLKALDPKTCDEYCFKNVTDEFNDEMGRANRLTVNFYKAILQQSSGERSYATKFDNFYGDVTQQGIIMDKYFAMLLHLGLWEVGDYDQNLYAYLSYHETSHGNSLFYSDAQDVTDSMIGGQYDVYPWFKPLAVLVFAQDTHDVMFGDKSKQKWIEMRRYDRVQDMVDVFGFDPRVEALKVDNPYQTFKDKNANTWVYYYMADRNQHLVANKNTNPTAFKILWDQNERINVKKYDWVDDYEIKYYLDFYEYFN